MPISKFVSCLLSPHKLNHFLRRISVFELLITRRDKTQDKRQDNTRDEILFVDKTRKDRRQIQTTNNQQGTCRDINSNSVSLCSGTGKLTVTVLGYTLLIHLLKTTEEREKDLTM